MSESSFAPVVLFVFNRPDHTRATLTALSKNDLADRTDLIIYADAARSEADQLDVAAVRSLIRESWSFKSVTLFERDANVGLASNIIEGVTSACNKYGHAIVLEDDLVTSPFFLRYMNDALVCYKGSHKVSHVSGYMYPVPMSLQDATFFLRVPMCWGWATWNHAWKDFSRDLSVMNQFSRRDINKFNFSGTNNYWSQLQKNKSGAIKTWFVFWYAINFLGGRLTLFPRESLVRNIGHDGSGVHCDASSKFDVNLADAAIEVVPLDIVERADVVKAHEEYFSLARGSFVSRVLKRIASRFRIK